MAQVESWLCWAQCWQGPTDGLPESVREMILQKELNYMGDPEKMEPAPCSSGARKRKDGEDWSCRVLQ